MSLTLQTRLKSRILLSSIVAKSLPVSKGRGGYISQIPQCSGAVFPAASVVPSPKLEYWQLIDSELNIKKYTCGIVFGGTGNGEGIQERKPHPKCRSLRLNIPKSDVHSIPFSSIHSTLRGSPSEKVWMILAEKANSILI